MGIAEALPCQVLPQSVIPAMSGPVLTSASGDSMWGSATGALFSWEPFDFGLRHATVTGAEAAVARARAGEALTRLDVQTAVGTAFLNILGAQRTVVALQADLDRRDLLSRAVHTLGAHVVRHPDFQQTVASRKISNLDLEMYEDLEQRGGWILCAIYDAPASRMPPSGRAQCTVAGKRQVIADSPENHLRGHALIDSVQEFFNEARTGFGGHELERAAAVELPFRRAEPTPRAFGLSKNLFS